MSVDTPPRPGPEDLPESAAAREDHEAASLEISSNVSIRRLALVIVHAVLPAAVVAASDALSGSSYPPELRWLGQEIVPITAALSAAIALAVALVVLRCHFGLTLNGQKLRWIETGQLRAARVNLRGVGPCFSILAAMTAGASTTLFLLSWFGLWLSVPVGLALASGLVFALYGQVRRANALAEQLHPHWASGAVGHKAMEDHRQRSLSDANADLAIVVTMATALFAGFFGALTKFGGFHRELIGRIPWVDLTTYGPPALSAYLLISLLASARMTARLRAAIAWHAADLATLHGEPDDPWRFRILERSFLLHLVVVILAAVAALILFWPLLGASWALWIALGLGLALAAGYPYVLHREKRRTHNLALRLEGAEGASTGEGSRS